MEAPALGRIQNEFRDLPLTVVAVNTAPYIAIEHWVDYWRSKDADDVTWAQADPKGDLLRRYRVLSLGTTITIDREGQISYRDDGATPYETLRTNVEEIS